jgi:tRNA A-37 threonylcarbamoyl transferase component Bud32
VTDEPTPTASAATIDADPSLDGSFDLGARIALGSVLARLLGGSHSTRLGRYEVIETVGQGACGQVYRARDGQLDRDVAIKVLLPGRFLDDDGAEQRRLLDEARALARLRHPNVVEVFDVGVAEVGRHADGTTQHGVYLVMQWLPGDTLARFAATRPPWRALVDAYCQVAEGLQAAHDAGLVHGDVKPHNAIVQHEGLVHGDVNRSNANTDDAGRVHVVDFGLARDAEAPSGVRRTVEGSGSRTVATAIVGTPLYMAPEQHRGELSPHADQYALSVSLWQGLCGVAPFVGDSLVELAVAKQRVPPRPRGTGIPRAVWSVLRTGLAPSPLQRHRDLRAWVDALRAASRGRPPWRALGAAAAVVAVLGVGGASATRSWGAHPCDAAPLELESVWDDMERGRIQVVLAGLDHPDAVRLGDAAVATLDERAAQWRREWSQACHSDAGPEVALRVHACLSEARDAFTLAVARAGSVEPDGLEALESKVAGPPPRCLALASRTAEEQAEIAAIEQVAAALRRELERGGAEVDVVAIDAAIARADTLGRPDLVVAMQGDTAVVALRHHDLEAARERVHDAVLRANAAGLSGDALDLMTRLASVHGQLRETDEATRILGLAREHAARHGSTPEQRAALDYATGVVASFSEAADDGAETHYARSCETLIALPDPTAKVMFCTVSLVMQALNRGDVDAADRYLAAGVEASERVRRPSAGMYMEFDSAAAEIAARRGDFARAAEAARRNLERQRARGRSHVSLPAELATLAEFEAAQMHWDAALGAWDEAIALASAFDRPPFDQIAVWQESRLGVLLTAGHFDRVPAEVSRIIATTEGDADQVEAFQTDARLMLAWSLWATGDADGARRELARLDIGPERVDQVPAFAARLRLLLDPGEPTARIEAFLGAARRRRAARAEFGDVPSMQDATEPVLDALAVATVAAMAEPVPAGASPDAAGLRAAYVGHARALAMLRRVAFSAAPQQF